MNMIEIDFDVYKALTAKRETESTTYNDVLRELLKLGPVQADHSIAIGGWNYKGVKFPEGTQFKATYKGLSHYARIENGSFKLFDGRMAGSPSEAAHLITGTSVNGWTFWECQFPGELKWQLIAALRR
jgi:hypothetical protein